MPSAPSADRVHDNPAPLGRRERKKLATRDRILECAATLFASRGYDATTMDDIGECADVARATVFNHFGRKEDIVLEWFARRRTGIAEILAAAEQDTSDTPSRLRRAMRYIGRVYDDDPATARAMVRAWLRAGGPLLSHASDAPALFADTIRLGQKQGEVPPDVDATRAGLVIFDAYLGVLYRWVRDDDGQPPLERSLTAMLDMVLAGIAQGPVVERSRKGASKKRVESV